MTTQQAQVTAYFRRLDDGAILTRTLTQAEGISVRIPPPAGAVRIEQAEALTEIDRHRELRDQRIAADRARRIEQRDQAARRLIELGLDEATAAFLTGAAPT